MNEQIPISCAINVAIINKISNTDTFKDACKNVPIIMGVQLPNAGAIWPFFNVSWSAYMMYSFFVVPKEIYSVDKNDEFYAKLVSKNFMKNFTISKQRENFDDNPLYHFGCFRNSISHVNYDANENRIRFWDHPKGKKEQVDWHWEVEIETKHLPEFFIAISEANFNFYNEIKAGKRDRSGLVI